MARPTKPYSRRNVQSYERDREYLLRLRNAVWLDSTLDSEKVKKAIEAIDAALMALRDLSSAPSQQTGT